MSDETAPPDAELVDDAPMPAEAAAAIEDYLPTSAELAVIDRDDRHEVMLRMDEHDVRMLLERVQSSALRKWVYRLPSGETGLTVHAVQDITQQMNWSGKCRIGVLPDTLEVERVVEDAGNGEEPFWVATIFARDEVTGQMQPGSSMEPVRMRLKPDTARKKREKGMKIPEDNTIFDVFSRTKAIQKATRNAQASFIPEEIEQTVIAMYEKDPARVERIQTVSEQQVASFPPPLDDEKAKALVARCNAIYDEIKELGAGQGKIALPPGQYFAYVTQAQHSHEQLENLVGYLEERLVKLTEQFAQVAS